MIQHFRTVRDWDTGSRFYTFKASAKDIHDDLSKAGSDALLLSLAPVPQAEWGVVTRDYKNCTTIGSEIIFIPEK